MVHRDVIVIGASAGGVESLKRLVRALPADLNASIFVVLHLSPDSVSSLAAILASVGRLPVTSPKDGATIEKGHVYVAPPDQHLLLEPGHIRIVRGPKENRHRPAIDPLFRSAAWVYGPRVVAVVLSGNLYDGASGLWTVKSNHGVTIVQDPADSLFPDMPLAALATLEVDHRVSVDQMAPLLVKLSQEEVSIGGRRATANSKLEGGYTLMEKDVEDMARLGRPSAFTCPACRGALWQVNDGLVERYRCHIGHAYSSESLFAEQGDAVETALDTALRALEEKAEMSRRIAARFADVSPKLHHQHVEQGKELNRLSESIRTILIGRRSLPIRPNGHSSEPADWRMPSVSRLAEPTPTNSRNLNRARRNASRPATRKRRRRIRRSAR